MLYKLYIWSFFIPLEVFFKLGTFRLEPYRIILIFGFFTYLVNKKNNDYPLKLLYCYIFFTFISLTVNHGFELAVKTSGILYLEVATSYSIGAIYIKNKDLHKQCFSLLSFLFLLIAAPSLVEFFTGNKVIHKFFEIATGNIQLPNNLYGDDYIRMGFTRTTSVFSHPILYAVSASMLMPIIVSINDNEPNKRLTLSIKRLSGIIIGIITSISSIGFVTIAIQIALKLWYLNQKKLANLKKPLKLLFFLSLLIIQFGSNRGLIKVLAMTITLNPHTAYYRILQWDFTSDDIMDNFYFGIGYKPFTHPDWFLESIDSYWLNNMLQYGFFSTLFLTFFFIKLLKMSYVESNIDSKKNEILLGYRILLISIIVSGFSVDFFDKVQPLLFFVLGTTSWLFKEIENENNENKAIFRRNL